MLKNLPIAGMILILLACAGGRIAAAADRSEDLNFFESKVRPLLAERCLGCHGADDPESGLRVDHITAMLKGGRRGQALVPGAPDESLLLDAVRYDSTDLKMPPEAKLPGDEIATLEQWIRTGAAWPDESVPSGIDVKADPHPQVKHDQWWRQPVQRPPVPAVENASWSQTDVDRFILARLEAKGLHPAPPADRRTLIRRAYFDLIGLPPTPAEVEAFVGDDTPGAFERVVDRLLASPHYGEQMARHWLDTVRYADETRTGTELMPENYRYRDWVVTALGRDMPYDRFMVLQVAGDLEPPTAPAEVNTEGIVATGLFSLGEWSALDADKEKMLSDIVDDQIDVVGRVFLGVTLACSRCHDHKFDPFTTQDYYGLAGIFSSSHILAGLGAKGGDPVVARIPLVAPRAVAERQSWEKQVAELNGQIKALTPSDGQTPAGADELARLNEQLTALKSHEPPAVAAAHGLQEGGMPDTGYAGIHDAHIFQRGKYDRLGDIVPRRLPALLAGEAPRPIAAGASGSGRRDLGLWLADPSNPLPARVMVNRLWQWHFTAGIVRTSTNFGAMGTPPSHPELLDYLAARFIESGWSIKALHRLIMLSAVYQQSGQADSQALSADADNVLFGRMPRRRMQAEELHDALLAVAGKLESTLGGPSIADAGHSRRMLYSKIYRDQYTGFRQTFDAANTMAIVERRGDSTSAAQALWLLNDPWMLAQAQRLAERLLGEVPAGDEGRVQWLYALLYGRPASAAEVARGLAAIADAQAAGDQGAGLTAEQAWELYCQALLMTNEFLYID